MKKGSPTGGNSSTEREQRGAKRIAPAPVARDGRFRVDEERRREVSMRAHGTLKYPTVKRQIQHGRHDAVQIRETGPRVLRGWPRVSRKG